MGIAHLQDPFPSKVRVCIFGVRFYLGCLFAGTYGLRLFSEAFLKRYNNETQDAYNQPIPVWARITEAALQNFTKLLSYQ